MIFGATPSSFSAQARALSAFHCFISFLTCCRSRFLAMASFDQVDANHDGVISREESIVGKIENGRRAYSGISLHGSEDLST